METISVLRDQYNFRCCKDGPLFCQQCESCKLQEKINLTKAWFIPLSDFNKKVYLQRLIASSDDVVLTLSKLLHQFCSKDYQYAQGRLMPSIHTDNIQENSDHSIDVDQVENFINVDYLHWFATSSEWARYNYILYLLQNCSFALIKTIKGLTDVLKAENETVQEARNEESPVNIIFDEQPLTGDVTSLPSKSILHRKNRVPSAKTKLTFADDCQSYNNIHDVDDDDDDDVPLNIGDCKSQISFYSDKTYQRPQSSRLSSRALLTRSSHATSISKYDLSMIQSSARCTPVAQHDLHCTTPNSMLNPVSDDYCHETAVVVEDILRMLPIHLSKKILGYLSDDDLKVIVDVSDYWKVLAEQVLEESILFQLAKEDVMMIQGASAKTPNPCYARMVPVYVPVIDSNGIIVYNPEGKHIDVVNDDNEYKDINMENCYTGIETQQIMMDERNVYCSSYNVFVVETRKDHHRRIHYNAGQYVGIGSLNRQVVLVGVDDVKDKKVFRGHTGSIKTLFVDERNGLVVSAGYDTSIRVWDLRTGRCKNILIGHKGSVICLAVTKKYIASAATDKTVKVWSVGSGRCRRTVRTVSVVKTILLEETTLLTGSECGKVVVSEINGGSCGLTIVKTLEKHTKAITCLKVTHYHIFSGSLDCYVVLWSRLGELDQPIITFRHPSHVLALATRFCRLVTACEDGKIRVWNYLNGECLRVIRGNSKNDPITSLFASKNRLVVNTVNCILVYNFEKIQWDYTAPRDRGLVNNKNNRPSSSGKKPHSYTRALKIVYQGSPVHHQTQYERQFAADDVKNESTNRMWKYRSHDTFLSTPTRVFHQDSIHTMKSENSTIRLETRTSMRSIGSKYRDAQTKRGQSAPLIRTASTFESAERHISRIKSAQSNIRSRDSEIDKRNTIRKSKMSKGHEEEIPWQGFIKSESSKFDMKSSKMKPNRLSNTTTRCRSAPLQRIKTLPTSERGFTTSSFSYTTLPCNKMIPSIDNRPKTARAPIRRLESRISFDDLTDLKIKTFHLQLQHEEYLKGK